MAPRAFRRVLSAILALALPAVLLLPASASRADSGDARFAPRVSHAGFLPNRGQAPPGIRFHTLGAPVRIACTRDAVLLGDPAVRWRIADVAAGDLPAGTDSLRTHYNFYGARPASPVTGVPAFAEVVYRNARAGFDLHLRRVGAALEYEWTAREAVSGSAPPEVGLEGASFVPLDERHVRVVASWGSFVLERSSDGRSGRFLFASDGGGKDMPGGDGETDGLESLIWGTYLGGVADENERGAVVVDGGGGLIVTGATFSGDFPVTPAAWDSTYGGAGDVFVARVDSTGADLLWCTFLGGGGWDRGSALVLDGAGNFLLTGFTESVDFPATPGAVDTTYGGDRDAFLARMDVATGTLDWCTYLGGSDWDEARAVTLAGGNRPIIAGLTFSTDFPVTAGVYRETYRGLGDMFISKYSQHGDSLQWSTYLGGDDFDQATGVTQVSGKPTVVGESYSLNFPSRAMEYDPDYNGAGDAVAAQLNSSASGLIWGTFLGGTDLDAAWCVEPAGDGDFLVGGFTWSADFPRTAGVLDPYYNGQRDGFILKLAASGDSLRWSSYLGGFNSDAVWDLARQSSGTIVVTGETSSFNFPVTTGSFDGSFNGVFDAFVTRIDGDGSAVLWSSFLGGSEGDVGASIGLGPMEQAYVFGWTRSDSFPTTPGAWSETRSGLADAFLVRMAFSEETSVTSESLQPVFPPGCIRGVTPNPFRGQATVALRLPEAARVRVDVHDARGRLCRRLFAGVLPAGENTLYWDGAGEDHDALPPGVYFLRLSGDAGEASAKVILLR